MSGIVRSPLVGLVLLALFGGWSLLAHPDAPQADAWAAACAVTAGGLLIGWALGQPDPALPGLLALGIAVGAVLVTLPESLSGNPTAPPLGYMNANGALLLAGAAGAVVAAGGRALAWRLAAALVSLLLSLVCLVEGAQTGAIACLLVAVWALLRGHGPEEPWTLAGVALVAVPTLLPVAWAADRLPRPDVLVTALTDERFALWSESWELLGDEPVSGVGPGRFSLESPTAADPDLAWAHSALLQTGAELGWVGVGLLVGFVVWALVALGRDGVLLGLLLLPASVDYVLHFGGVLLVSSIVVGGAMASSGSGNPWLTPPSP